MTRVYGGCIEPGGMELEDNSWRDPCPRCGKPAHHRWFQRLDGGVINPYMTISCDRCDHREGFDDLLP